MAQQSNGKRVSSEDDDDKIINAMPTKELFIDMLTRDIALIPAIIDLVDNSGDGARKVNGDDLKGFWTRVEIGDDQFKISDNCGGMTVDTAKNYAFRFGRAKGAPSVTHSVGQFGVGMKRAIFKMGRKFRVESTTSRTRFVVEVDVDKWAAQDEWRFKFLEIEEDAKQSADAIGTTILVTKLHHDVAEKFQLESFRTELKNELQARLKYPISRGLATSLNKVPVTADPMKMLSDPQLLPAYKRLNYSANKTQKPVTVELYCGIGRSGNKFEERADAGWHVYCNGRLILEADKTEVTGWGAEADDANETSIPGFHGQYNNLRGFAYFDSDDPARLPWNTTKTGLNTDSPVYRSVKQQMILLMRPVIDFLNKLKDEKQAKDEDDDTKGPLERIVEKSTQTSIDEIDTRPGFKSPEVKSPKRQRGAATQKIQYEAPADRVALVKEALDASSFTEVGRKTFDYFYDAEVK